MCHDDVSLNCISRYKTLFFEKVEINKCIFFYKVIFKNIYIKKRYYYLYKHFKRTVCIYLFIKLLPI